MLLSQVSEIKNGRVITKDSTNHLGEKEYQTYNAWREACKRINPNAQFEGDKDICQAKPGIGEWGGDKGVIYTKDSTQDADTTTWKCNECGKTFKKDVGKNTSEIKCPSCGSEDIDLLGHTKDSRSDDIQRMIEKLEDSLDSISSGPRVAEIKAKIQELEAEKNKLGTGDCTEDSILTDILGNVSDFLAQVMGSGKAKDCKATDGGVGSGQKGHITARQLAVMKMRQREEQTGSAGTDSQMKHERMRIRNAENKGGPSGVKALLIQRLYAITNPGKAMVYAEALESKHPFVAAMARKKAKNLAKDSASPNSYSDVVQDKNIAALIELFSSDKEIKDHEVFHALAALLGIENPSDLEEMAYAMLQSYFSKGKYMTQGGDKPIDPKELAMGDKTEREHTDNPVFARKIALDHLSEIPDYYTRLAAMEKIAATKDGGPGSGQKGHKTGLNVNEKRLERLNIIKMRLRKAAEAGQKPRTVKVGSQESHFAKPRRAKKFKTSYGTAGGRNYGDK